MGKACKRARGRPQKKPTSKRGHARRARKGEIIDPTRYKPVKKFPFIPTEKELDQLIVGCGHQMATFLQLLKETGMICGEAYNLKWTDIDFVNNSVGVTPGNSSNPRIFKISNKLASMLSRLPKTLKEPSVASQSIIYAKPFQKCEKESPTS